MSIYVTITDVYLSAEAKGGVKSFEAGGQYRVSVYSNSGGLGLSNPGLNTAVKQKFGKRFTIEHDIRD